MRRYCYCMSRNETKPVTFVLSTEQLAWVEAEAERVGAEAGGGAHISKSAIVRRALDEARKRQGGGDGR